MRYPAVIQLKMIGINTLTPNWSLEVIKYTLTMKTCKKKAQGYKIQVKFFCHFWFFVILGKIMKFMNLKFT